MNARTRTPRPLSLRRRERLESLRHGQHSAASIPWSRAVRIAYGMAERKPNPAYVGQHRAAEQCAP